MGAPFALVVARWLFFASAAILFGSSLLRLYAPREGDLVALWPHRLAARLLSALALVAAAAWLLALSHSLSDRSNLFTTAWIVLSQTTFGPFFAARLVFGAGAVIAACMDRKAAVAAAAAILLLCEGGDGHAAAQGWFGEGDQAIHALAAGAWIGGLFPLASALIAARRAEAPAAALPIVQRFSTVAFGAVVVVLATGVVNVILIKPSLSWSSPYARALALKLSLVATMIALALVNRLRLTPRLNKAQGRQAIRQLINAVLLEELLGVAALAVVAWLGELDPYVKM